MKQGLPILGVCKLPERAHERRDCGRRTVNCPPISAGREGLGTVTMKDVWTVDGEFWYPTRRLGTVDGGAPGVTDTGACLPVFSSLVRKWTVAIIRGRQIVVLLMVVVFEYKSHSDMKQELIRKRKRVLQIELIRGWLAHPSLSCFSRVQTYLTARRRLIQHGS